MTAASHPLVVDAVSKIYRLYASPAGRLKEALWRGRKSYHHDFWALKDISFTVEKGETVGVIGRNGSGKSTLLQLLAGIMPPTYGAVKVNGKISALLELGSGFDPDFTGRENVFMNGAILGFTREQMEDRFPAIEQFAEIGEFMDQPVKLYSSGMFVRLAFATAISVDPDILLVDEALAVGDTVFQHRCMNKIHQIQKQGKTIFFVSHDLSAVQKLCTRAILLEKGEMVCIGTPEAVTGEYHRIVWNIEKTDPPDDPSILARRAIREKKDAALQPVTHYDERFGSRVGEIVGWAITDDSGQKRHDFRSGERLHFTVAVRCHADISMPLAGLLIKDLLGNELIKTNTDVAGFMLKPLAMGETGEITFIVTLPDLRSGSYSISVAFGIGTMAHHSAYDWIGNIAVFTMECSQTCLGLIKAPVEVRQTRTGDHLT